MEEENRKKRSGRGRGNKKTAVYKGQHDNGAPDKGKRDPKKS